MIKYAIVTGCSKSSIGFLSSKILASKPYDFTVILGCRNEQKGKEAEEEIKKQVPGSNVIYKNLDLASFESIHKFVDEVNDLENFKTAGLSLLVNNAGVGWGSNTPYLKTKNDLEEIVGVNHFGHFLLTNLLLPNLKQPESARVVIVSSSLHDLEARKKQKDDDNNGPKMLLPNFPQNILVKDAANYDGALAYRISKLCNVWFGYELQRRLNNENNNNKIKVISLTPGFIPTTGLTRRSGFFGIFFLHYIIPWFGITRTPDDGALSIVLASVDNDLKGGEYIHLAKGSSKIEVIKSSVESYDENKAKELWDMSDRIVNGDKNIKL